MRSKNGWVLLVMLLSGIVLGGFIGMLTANVSGLSWLNYGQSFGLESPIVLDLGLLVLTFGLQIQISIASIIGVVLAIIIYRKLYTDTVIWKRVVGRKPEAAWRAREGI